MTKVLAIVIALAMVCVFMVGCKGGAEFTPELEPEPAAVDEKPESPTGPEKENIGFYIDVDNSYYSLIYDAFVALANQDPECDWTANKKTGNNTAEEQLKAVEDFIAADYDAIIVIQNNPDTTSNCIVKCKAAGIPYFGAAHSFASVENSGDATGSVNYDLVHAGRLAGQDALDRGVTKLVMIEDTFGQGSVSAQSVGFLLAYCEAGKSLGEKEDGTLWTPDEIAEIKPSVSDVKGSPDIKVVSWKSDGWTTEQAFNEMLDLIDELGKDGWDGAYVQNNQMAEGVIEAMADQGLSINNYWLGSMNGSEISWGWVQDGFLSFDVNQSAAMEGALLYQMVKEFFQTGVVSKKHVNPYMTSYTINDISQLIDSLVPCTDIDAFVDGLNQNKFIWKIDDTKFLLIKEYQ